MLSHYKDQDFYCSFTKLPHADREVNLDELPYTIHSIYSINRLRPRGPAWPPRRETFPRETFPRPRSRTGTLESIESRTSFPFTANSPTSMSPTSSSGFSKISTSTGTSTSSRRKRLLAAPFLMNMFPSTQKLRKGNRRSGGGTSSSSGRSSGDSGDLLLLQRQRKPSTLDFRCIGPVNGMEEDLVRRLSGMHFDMVGEHEQEPDSITTWMNGTTTPAVPDAPKIDWRQPDVHDDWNTDWFADID